MEFKELIMGRYATKKFDGRKIDDETLDQILEMIRFSPSALNIQPWKIKVITDDDLKAKLSPASLDQAQIKTCSHLLVFCANTDLKGNAKKLVNGLKAAGIPQEKVEQYQRVLDNFINIFASNELCEAQNNVFIAATQALYAAKSVGVDYLWDIQQMSKCQKIASLKKKYFSEYWDNPILFFKFLEFYEINFLVIFCP
ncbi:MAG: nitroreductase family protein [Methanobacterium paludis]|nr:nitroreductase family protein [Methanobacterium paludis]